MIRINLLRLAAKRRPGLVWRLIAVGVVAGALAASEYHGSIVTNNVPVPGATVTATHEGEKLVTTTDDRGVFRFPSIADGVWKMQVDMMGFASDTHEVGVAADAPSPKWNLRLFTEEEAAAPSSGPAVAPPASAAARAPEPAAPAAAAIGLRRRAGAGCRDSARGRGFGGRGGPAQSRTQAAAADTAQTQQASLEFQQIGVNQASDRSLFSQEGLLNSEQAAELAPSANQAVVVQGSMSSALGMPGMGDFGPFAGRGGMGPRWAWAALREWA